MSARRRGPGGGWRRGLGRLGAALVVVAAVTVVRTETPASAAIGDIRTYAGNGKPGFTGDGGAAINAAVGPRGVAVDRLGNLFIADAPNNRVRKVDTSGFITTVAGNGKPGSSGDNGPALAAGLDSPTSVAVDANGNLFIASDIRVRKVDTGGVITTYAGTGTAGYNGDHIPAASAKVDAALGLAVDGAGNLFIADTTNNRVRKVDTSGVITTYAGTGNPGFSGNGTATTADLNQPTGLALDAADDLFIGDDRRVRKVDTKGAITTVAGNGSTGSTGDGGPATSAKINNYPGPDGLVVDPAGDLFIADNYGDSVRKVDPATGIITTVAGAPEPISYSNGGFAGDGGLATSAKLNGPEGLAVDPAGNLFIADVFNGRVRKVQGAALPTPTVTSVTPPEGPAAGGTLVTITGTNFSTTPGATTVTFGAAPATSVNCATTRTCTAVSPAGTGTIDVTVNVRGKPSVAGPADRFTYIPAQLGQLNPGCGATAGGTTVTITGTGLAAATGVHFGTTAGTGLKIISDSIITIVSPPDNLPSVAVTVTTPTATLASPGGVFARPCPQPPSNNGGTSGTGANGNAANGNINSAPKQPGSFAGPGGGGGTPPAPAPAPAPAAASAPVPFLAPASGSASASAPVQAPGQVQAPAPGQAPGQVQAPAPVPVWVSATQAAPGPALATGREASPDGAADYAMVRYTGTDGVPGTTPWVAAGVGMFFVGGLIVGGHRTRTRLCLAVSKHARP